MRNIEKLLSYYEKQIDFHFCRPEEIGLVEEFIENHWKQGHALAHSRTLMDWQHFDRDHGRYNFVLAVERSTGLLLALQGFITTRIFDPAINMSALCGAIWKSCCEERFPGVGILLQQIMIDQVEHGVLFGLGMSHITERVNRTEKRRMGLLHQYYIINREKTDFLLAEHLPPVRSSPCGGREKTSFFLLDRQMFSDGIFLIMHKLPAFKSPLYYVNRFFGHPIYRYHATAICGTDQKFRAVFFWRKCVYESTACLRIVDYIGDGSELSGCHDLFQELLKEENAEYIDFYQTGIAPEHLFAAGFLDRSDSNLVLANYFEPFLLKNVDLNYSWQGPMPPLLFKGDADMDRPNLIEV